MFYKHSSKTEYAKIIQCLNCFVALGTPSTAGVSQQTVWLEGGPT